MTALRRVRARAYFPKIIVLAVTSSEELAIEALRAGVDDYLRPPFTAGELVSAVRRQISSRQPLSAKNELLGDSQAMQDLRTKLKRIAAANCNVLVTGETGTGKELAAAAIHSYSTRWEHRLICMNCAAIP